MDLIKNLDKTLIYNEIKKIRCTLFVYTFSAEPICCCFIFVGVIKTIQTLNFSMKNSVASCSWKVGEEIKLSATGEINVRYGFVDIASLSPVAVCYGDTKYLKRIMDIRFGFTKSSHFFR